MRNPFGQLDTPSCAAGARPIPVLAGSSKRQHRRVGDQRGSPPGPLRGDSASGLPEPLPELPLDGSSSGLPAEGGSSALPAEPPSSVLPFETGSSVLALEGVSPPFALTAGSSRVALGASSSVTVLCGPSPAVASSRPRV